MSENIQPYKALGERIKFLREQWKQSLNELSASLEIDLKTLGSIESGHMLPSDEQLEMLANHFLLTEDQADDLFNLASAHVPKIEGIPVAGIEDQLMKQLSIMLPVPIDNRIVYTDSMKAQVNDNGVMFQFMQSSSDGKQVTVARLGMSQQHAIEVSKVIVRTLEQYLKAKKENKKLPPNSSN